jgi:hypothetical protein
LGASPAPPGTGLSACIFFASGKKGYRFNPLRCYKTASLPFYSFEFLRGKNSQIAAAGIPAAGIIGIYTVGFYRKVEKVKEVE